MVSLVRFTQPLWGVSFLPLCAVYPTAVDGEQVAGPVFLGGASAGRPGQAGGDVGQVTCLLCGADARLQRAQRHGRVHQPYGLGQGQGVRYPCGHSVTSPFCGSRRTGQTPSCQYTACWSSPTGGSESWTPSVVQPSWVQPVHQSVPPVGAAYR